MEANSGVAKVSDTAVYTVRIARETLDKFHAVAAAQHRTTAQLIRVLIEAAISDHDSEREAA